MFKDKIIFLDIDGVIATIKEYNCKKTSKYYITKYDVYPFNSKCVQILNEILEETNAEIVLSSNWSNFYSLDQMKDIFKINGVNKTPYDMIKQLAVKMSSSDDQNRGYSINEYIKEHKDEFNNYVIIDDLDIRTYGKTWTDDLHIDQSKFVHCSHGDFEGIKQNDIKNKIINILNK